MKIYTIEWMLEYHKANPHIWKAFEKFTFQAIGAGRKNFSVQGVIERIRWFSAIESKTGDFKVNEVMKAFYGRMFEHNHPQHKGFFRKKKSYIDKYFEVS